MKHRLEKILLIWGDWLVFYASLYLTLFVRYGAIPNEDTWRDHLWLFTSIFPIYLIIFYISDLYNLHIAANRAYFYRQVTSAVLVSSLLAALAFYLLPEVLLTPKTNLAVFTLFFSFLTIFWRRQFNIILHKYLPKERIISVGHSTEIDEIKEYLDGRPYLGYRLSRNLSRDEAINGLAQVIQECRAQTIVLAEDLRSDQELRQVLFQCLPQQINITSVNMLYEHVTGKVPVRAIEENWFLENLNLGQMRWYEFCKRVFDTVTASIVLCFLPPLVLLIALGIRLSDKGPIIFTQLRQGKQGRIFKLRKFRTMRVTDNDFRPTSASDNRIFPFGLFLRRSRLDEIPQLWNILIGDMSFVGPRPERPELATELEKQIPFYRERLLVKPGLTGWDQVSGEYHSPSVEDTIKKLQYDLFYVKNRSFYLDLSIILKTIHTVLSRKGL